MRLNFMIKTNTPEPWINTAIFVAPSGEQVVIDRHQTEWSSEQIGDDLYRIDMLWRECYVWDGEDEHTLSDEDASVNYLRFVEFELEDDVDREDYFVEVEGYSWS